MFIKNRQEIKRKMRLQMRNLALTLGVKKNHTDYVRFIILGRSRVGSNLLRGLLNAHSQIEAYGEVFRNREGMDWDHLNALQSDNMHQMMLRDPVSFLDKKVFRKYSVETAAVGFKIFYYHAREGSWEPVWPYLLAQTELRVIHIKRRNVLKTHLSRKRAEITDSWVNTTGAPEKPVSVTLDYAECLADFIRTRAWEEEADTQFAQHSVLQLAYEDLARDYEGEMRRVQAFLGVDYEVVRPSIHKQSRQTLAEAITNYDELKQQFAGTLWAEFFE